MKRRILLSAPLGILLTPTLVLAAKLSKPVREVQTLPEVPRPAAGPQPQQAAAPRLSVEDFLGHQRGRIQSISDKQIVYLQRLIQLASPDDPQVPDYLFRLGDLLTEKHRFWNSRVRGHDEPIFRAEQAHDGNRAAQERREQEREQQRANQALRKAVEAFVATAKYPRYARMDEVLYRLGYLLEQSGSAERARAIFHRLLKEYPGSRYVPHAYLSFAENAFAKGDMGQALAFYTKVAQFPDSPLFGFALYKKAWGQANLGDAKAALTTLVELLAQCQAGKVSPVQRVPLAKEARRDLVRVYARVPGASPDRAWDFFRRVGGSDAPTMLQSLAEIYWEEGMAAASTRVYRKIMALEPGSPLLCTWQDKVLRNTLSAGTESEQVQELRRFGTAYRHLTRLANVRSDVVAECRSRYHDITREQAIVLHKQAQRLKQLPTYQLAAVAYREFLGAFASEPAAIEVAFYYAECLWQIAALSEADDGLWRQAAEQYTRVVHLDPKGPHVKEAAYAAVLAWQNELYDNDDDLRPRS